MLAVIATWTYLLVCNYFRNILRFRFWRTVICSIFQLSFADGIALNYREFYRSALRKVRSPNEWSSGEFNWLLENYSSLVSSLPLVLGNKIDKFVRTPLVSIFLCVMRGTLPNILYHSRALYIVTVSYRALATFWIAKLILPS